MHIWSSFPEAAVDLEQQLAQWASRSFAELERLPTWSAVSAASGATEFTLNRKTLADGRIELVLQAYRPGRRVLFFKFGQMLARGFWIAPDGTQTRMPESALYDYM